MIRTPQAANQRGQKSGSISLINALIPSYNYENPTNRMVAHQPPTLPDLEKCLRYLTLTQLSNCLDVLHAQFHSFPPGPPPNLPFYGEGAEVAMSRLMTKPICQYQQRWSTRPRYA